MAIILSIETSTAVCAVALHADGVLIGSSAVNQQGAHSERLMRMIEELMEAHGISAGNMDAISVSEGPGSYTGLRIGVSTAKGLAYGWDLPLIGVNTLKAQARAVQERMNPEDKIISMIDARRMEVYRQIFNSDREEIGPLDAAVIDSDSFRGFLDEGKVYFVGDAVPKIRQVILHANAVFLDLEISAGQIGELAFEKYKNKAFEDLAYFVPNYLKEFKVLQSKKNLLML